MASGAADSSGSTGTSAATTTPLSQQLSFKFDNIERLKDGTAYCNWCGIMQLYLRRLKLKDYINGTITKPTDPTALENWEDADISARLTIASMVHSDIAHLVFDAPSAQDAWKALQDCFHIRNPTTLFNSVQNFFAIKMTDNDTMLDHILNYEQKHQALVERCKDIITTDPHQHLARYLEVDKIRAQHLLITLPDSFSNIADNIQSKTTITYSDTRLRLFELHSSGIKVVKNRALNVKGKSTGINKNNLKKSNLSCPGKSDPVEENNCSWCKKRGLPHSSDTYKTCAELKKFNASNTSKPTSSGKEVVLYRAATAQHLTSNESGNGVAFTVSPSSPQLVLSPSRPLHNVPANYTTHEVWNFDTGASFHIPADFSHLQEPVRCHLGLTVGGERVRHATHQGNISLDVEVSSCVISVSLSDVLCVPDWNKACLISWRKIDELGRFRMIGENGIIDIIRKDDNAIVFSASLQHGSYQVYPIIHHGKIYIAATDFRHQALGYTYTRC